MRTTPGGRLRETAAGVLRWIAVLALALGFALGLTACDDLAPPSPLVVGVDPWVGHDPLVLARDRGLSDARLVKVVELISSAESVRHLRNGLLDAAGLTLQDAWRLADSGVDVRIVALLGTSVGGDVVLAAPHMRSLKQLRGSRIAVEDATVGTLMLERLLQKAGLRHEDVTVVRLDATQHLIALQSERVAAAVSYAPIDETIRREGYHAVFDSREMPGEIVDVLVVRTEVLRHRPEAVDALLAAWANGLAAVQGNPTAAAEALAPGVGLTAGQYEAVQEGLRYYTAAESMALLTGQPPPLAQQGQDVALLLTQMGVLQGPPRWDALIDTGPALRAPAPGARP